VARWPPPRGTPESDSLLLFLSTPNTINVNCVCYLHSTNWAARCFLLPPPPPQTSFDNHRRVWTKQRTNLFEKFPNEIQISRQNFNYKFLKSKWIIKGLTMIFVVGVRYISRRPSSSSSLIT
jgi:hypothetical protein